MKKHVLLKYDVNKFWKIWRIKTKLSNQLKKKLTWEDFVFLVAVNNNIKKEVKRKW